MGIERASGPWDQYASSAMEPTPQPVADGPWARYAAQPPAAAPAESPSIASQVLRSIGLTARAGLTGASGTIGAVGDALNAGINAVAGTHLKPLSRAIQDVGTQAGLPVPQGTGENFSTGVASLLAGGFDPAMAGLSRFIKGPAPLYNAPSAVDVHANTIKAGQDAGLKVLPSEARAGVPGRMLEAASSKNLNAATIQNRNIAATDALSRSAAGLPSDAPLTAETLNNAITNTYEQGYKPITELGQIPTSPNFHKALDDIAAQYQGVSGSFPGAAKADVAQTVNSFRVPSYDAGDAVKAISQLRSNASDAFAQGNSQLGGAQRAIAKTLEDNIEQHLSSKDALDAAQGILNGQIRDGQLGLAPSGAELLQQFHNARTQLAKQYAVRDAIIPGAGSVDALKYAAQLQSSGTPLTGELRTLAEFAKNAPKSAAYPKSGAPLMSSLEGIGMAGAGIAGAMSGGAGHLAAAVPLARVGARQLLATGLGQRLFAQPATPSVLTPYLQNALPTALTLGSGLYGQ